MKKKLRNAQGETLVEVLASILICTLSVTLLFGAVMASSNIDLTAQEADKAYYETLSEAEAQTVPLNQLNGSALTDNRLAVTVVNNGDKTSIEVSFYGGDALFSYAAAGTSGGGG